jgi:hypothetical protein
MFVIAYYILFRRIYKLLFYLSSKTVNRPKGNVRETVM